MSIQHLQASNKGLGAHKDVLQANNALLQVNNDVFTVSNDGLQENNGLFVADTAIGQLNWKGT